MKGGRKMDTSKLLMVLMGEVLIAIGVPLLAIARYLLAPDEKKSRIARGIKVIAIVWMAVGVLIYIRAFLGAIMKP
jgi:hypothetical protein